MHGIRYLSIVTPKFIRIALALTWLVPLLLSTAAFVWFHVSLQSTDIFAAYKSTLGN